MAQIDPMRYIVAASLSFSGVFAFLSAGSFVYSEVYGISYENIGYLFSVNVITMFFFNYMNGVLTKKYSAERILVLCILIQALASIWMIIAGIVYSNSLCLFVAGIALYCGINTSIYSNLLGCVFASSPQYFADSCCCF